MNVRKEEEVVVKPPPAPVVVKKEEIKPPIVERHIHAAPVSERTVAAPKPVVTERIVTERPVYREPVVEHVHTKPKRSWLPLAIGLGALALGALLLGRRAATERHVAEAPPPPVETPMVQEPAPVAPPPTAQTTVTSAEVPKATEEVDTLSEHFTKKGVPDRITLSDVTFDFATTKLSSGADTIDCVATLMKEHPNSRLRIEGYTDSVGNAKTNAALSSARRHHPEDAGRQGRQSEADRGRGSRDAKPGRLECHRGRPRQESTNRRGHPHSLSD